MKKIFSLALVALAIFMACNKDKDEITFEGITSRNEEGILIFNDVDDWRINDVWSAKETALFSDTQNNICANGSASYSIECYPNPCTYFVIIENRKPDNNRFALRIVDQDFNILLSHDSLNSEIFMINIKDFNKTNQIIRVYYKFYEENCELKGHGDIEVK